MSSLFFLIDTDWVIDHFNNVAEVTQRLRELAPQGLALSIISAAELWEGVISPETNNAVKPCWSCSFRG